MKNKAFSKKIITFIALMLMVCVSMSGCSSQGSGGKASGDVLADYSVSDMTGYSGLSGYEKETVFVDVTMDDISKLMDSQSSFVLYCGYDNCPWCNALIQYLNDVALEQECKIAYLDTRRDPSWQSNVDIEGYDKFVEYFGEYLDPDAEGLPHLYVPDVYFVKNGEVVERHEGVTPGLESPTDQLTEAQKTELHDTLTEAFLKIKE